ncbi:hypothetical protein CO614_03845 [Lysobacteraceae bacterium NML120232]|nr:hypothetical protein CO614_03845 [Xanthomonadaceae bacterium NML120232]
MADEPCRRFKSCLSLGDETVPVPTDISQTDRSTIMKTRNKVFSALALGLALAAGVSVAAPQRAAMPTMQHEAVRDLAAAKISLVRAIEIAERHVGGRATSADLGRELGRVVFEVEVVARDNTVHEVKVDGVSGAVISSRVDND